MKPRILVIDDDAEIRKSFKMTLEYAGYDVVLAATGEEGVKLVENDAPDLVFCDIKMPGMDGLEVLQKLRHLVEVTPIVIITTEGSQEDRQRALQLGANAYITKPIQAPQVIATVKELLKID